MDNKTIPRGKRSRPQLLTKQVPTRYLNPDKPGIEHLGSGYTDEERRFLKAMDAWKTKHRKAFPELVEVFRVIKRMGYMQVPFLPNTEN